MFFDLLLHVCMVKKKTSMKKKEKEQGVKYSSPIYMLFLVRNSRRNNAVEMLVDACACAKERNEAIDMQIRKERNIKRNINWI